MDKEYEPGEFIRIVWDNTDYYLGYGQLQYKSSFGIVLSKHKRWKNYFVYDFRRKNIIEFRYDRLEKINIK